MSYIMNLKMVCVEIRTREKEIKAVYRRYPTIDNGPRKRVPVLVRVFCLGWKKASVVPFALKRNLDLG